MFHFVSGDIRSRTSMLCDAMFRARRETFIDQLGWKLRVDTRGHEVDEYDDEHSTYLIANSTGQQYAGSVRFRPTSKGAMINDHFQHLCGGKSFTDDSIWEITRYNVPKKNPLGRRASLYFMLAANQFLANAGSENAVFVTTPSHAKLFQMMGWNTKTIQRGHCVEGAIQSCSVRIDPAKKNDFVQRGLVDCFIAYEIDKSIESYASLKRKRIAASDRNEPDHSFLAGC